jgi:hypothetical protein
MRIIWIEPKFPLGAPDGARHATSSLVRSLTQRGVDIHMICLVPKGEKADEDDVKERLGVSSCSILPRSGSKYWPLPGLRTPFTFRTFAAPPVRQAMGKELIRLLKDGHPAQRTFVVFDGLHAFASLSEPALRALSSRCAGIVYRAHNYETALWQQCAERARWPWFRWLFRYQTALVKAFERRIARSVDLIAPVSGEDGERFRALAPGTPASVTPIGMDFASEETVRPVAARDFLALLFVGRLDWLPNRTGLQWFMETIWKPLLEKRSGVTLQVAGTGDGRWFQKFLGGPGLSFLGRVDRVEPLYESCTLSLAPIFQGSGTRVKILESARYARAVATTALGAEGLGLTPGRSYFRAENRDEWLDLLSTVTTDDCREAGRKAFEEVRARFDAGAIAGRFMGALNTQGNKGDKIDVN